MSVPVMALNSSPAIWLEVPNSLHRQCRRGLAKTFLLTDLFNHIPRDVRCQVDAAARLALPRLTLLSLPLLRSLAWLRRRFSRTRR